MQTPMDLQSAERKVFQTTCADGLWDILIGCIFLEFAIAPFLSGSLGDFWSSAIFLPFWALVYLGIRLIRKKVIEPRVGTVQFGKARKIKLRRFSIIMMIVNTLVFGLGILVAFTFNGFAGNNALARSWIITSAFGFFLLAGFSLTAFLLDFPRLYLYGLLLFIAPFVGEWLYQNRGAVHHGYPIVYGVASGTMIITGLILFLRLLKNSPVIETLTEKD